MIVQSLLYGLLKSICSTSLQAARINPKPYYNNNCDMSSEIIQNVAKDNYDDFQHVNFRFFTKFHFHYFEDYYLMTKLTLG
jgi:hypothetical protein